mgnify:CR=1 FL=1
MRAGYKIRVCEEILQVNKAVINALTKVNLTVDSPGTEANLGSVFDLFSPDQPSSTDVLKSLDANFKAAKAAGMSNTEAWRFTFLPLCHSAITERL